MGVVKTYSCDQCDSIWNAYEGKGFDGELLYCDKCGKEIFVPFNKVKPKECTCGGHFQSSSIVCPCCGSKNITGIEEIGVWDEPQIQEITK